MSKLDRLIVRVKKERDSALRVYQEESRKRFLSKNDRFFMGISHDLFEIFDEVLDQLTEYQDLKKEIVKNASRH